MSGGCIFIFYVFSWRVECTIGCGEVCEGFGVRVECAGTTGG